MSKAAALDPISCALAEDIGTGDLTTQLFVPPGLQAFARIVANQKSVIAGAETAAEVFRRVDTKLHVQVRLGDGTSVIGGETVVEIRGRAQSILTAERVALNFLQRLSGIATITRAFVDSVAGSRAKILDTRKTTPGLRALEKAAVVAGGGRNHRFGLFDMVMVKDNHLSGGSGFEQMRAAIQRVRMEHPGIRVEVEADNLQQVRSFLEIDGIDVILLDNMPPSKMREAIALGKAKVEFEASGGVSLRNVRQIAATGVDYISVGALTHSAPAVDLSLELTPVGT
ncbi:MAG TPA: carboxylating nicotinate-nucleotide diphosphorylase [Chthoniobacterales bacterium]|nr:carboxylating nicotinate-nucleotide diphosphorylase [Chthoniobacterales bacterium]